MDADFQRFRVPLLVVMGLLTVAAAWSCLGLKVDRDNRSMSADLPELVAGEVKFANLFQEGESVLVAVTRPDLFEDAGKKFQTTLAEDLASIDGVAGVHGLMDTGFTVPPHFIGLLVSEDRLTAGIQLRLKDFSDDPDALDRFVEDLGRVTEKHRGAATRIAVAGIPLEKHESARLVLRDQRIFSPLCLVVLGLVLLAVTRRLSGMLLPLGFAVMTIAWTLGIYSASGHTLNMITSLLPPVIMTLSASTTIHVYMEWLHGSGADPMRRAFDALRRLTIPCLLVSGTTVLGFLSLRFSDTPAVRSFGLFAAIGVVIAFVVGFAGMASVLSFMRVPSEDHRHSGGVGRALSRLLAGSGELAIRHPGKIVGITLVLCVLGVVGAGKVRSNTDLLSFLGEESDLVRDTRYIDEHLTGTGVIELLLDRADGAPFVFPEELERIAAFEAKVHDLDHVRHTLGIVDLLASGGGIGAGADTSPARALVSPDQKTLRVTVAAESLGTREGAVLVEEIRRVARDMLGESYRVTGTGAYYRIIAESNQLTASQLKSFGVALISILLSIGIVFRSLRFLLLAILPNVAPLLLTAAIMGFCGIDLSTGTSMIASVMIGIAVDDTIHFLAAFRRHDRGDVDETIRTVSGTTGVSLFATTLALSLGFWVAIFGSFQPTVHFALLSGITLWLALAFDLVVLPACLKFTTKKSPQPQR